MKSASARLERTQNLAPKPRNPRDHPMVKLVGKTRAAISKAKKVQASSVFVDPEKSQLGTIKERQMKAKAEKLEKNREMHKLEAVSTKSKVTDYLLNNPITAKKVDESENAVVNYDVVREVLIEKQISLVSKNDQIHDGD